MDSTFNTYKVLPGFFYRSPEKARKDIKRIANEIEEITETLNARELLMNMLTECAKKEPERWLGELRELTLETQRSVEKLRRLDGLLTGLLFEWRYVKCAVTE